MVTSVLFSYVKIPDVTAAYETLYLNQTLTNFGSSHSLRGISWLRNEKSVFVIIYGLVLSMILLHVMYHVGIIYSIIGIIYLILI